MWVARRVAPILIGLGGMIPLIALTGCFSPAESGAEPTTIGTVGGVGELPVFNSEPPSSETPVSDESTSTSSPPETAATTPNVGQQVAGNRLLMIGDSLMASISKRYGGQACTALVPLGWQVEVDAETGRFIDFGKVVLDRRLSAGWDAVVLFLGNNYGHDQAKFRAPLHELLVRLAGKPVVMLTTTVFRPDQAGANDVIRSEAAQFPNVTLVDWATISQEPGLTGNDGLHLTDAGRDRLGYALADTLGPAPAQPGKCLETSFTDDSRGSPDGPSGSSNTAKPTSPTTAKPNTSTTTKPATTPTTAPASQTTSAPPTSPPPSTAAVTTAPATTAPATTAPHDDK
jgi:hypothetical protein